MPANRFARRTLALGCFALAASALFVPTVNAQQQHTFPAPIPTISASGSAVESRSPDQAEVTVGVQTTGKTSEEAQDALNQQMDKVIRAVKETKLAGLVTQTQGLALYPEYERVDNNARGRGPKITGYRASNSILARTSEVAKIGKIIDAAVAAGANQIMGISFTLKNDAEARRDAIRKATADSKAKAQAMADALGLTLGRVMQATTGGVQARPYRYNMPQGMMSRGVMEAMDAPTPVEAGEVNVSAEVTVEFAIVEPGK
jgi:uncharacterized protein